MTIGSTGNIAWAFDKLNSMAGEPLDRLLLIKLADICSAGVAEVEIWRLQPWCGAEDPDLLTISAKWLARNSYIRMSTIENGFAFVALPIATDDEISRAFSEMKSARPFVDWGSG